jgi:hypothetical protein
VHEVLWEPVSERPTARPELPDPVTVAPSPFDLEALAAVRREPG